MCASEDSETVKSPSFEQLHEMLRESTGRHARGLTSLVVTLLYLFITVASTTDLQLLLPESRISLPIIGVQLNLFYFSIAAPALILILHFNFMMNLLDHARKLKAWGEVATREQLVLLPGFILTYTYVFARRTFNYWLMRILQVAVICLAPLLLLLFVQIRFADYHDVWLTGWHLLIVFLDVFVLLVYWIRIAYPSLLEAQYDRLPNFTSLLGLLRRNRSILFGYTPSFLSALLVSAGCLLIVMLIKGDYFEQTHWYVPRLHVIGETLVKAEPSDAIIHVYLSKEKTIDEAWADHAEGIDLRRRDLRYARLDACNLPNAQLDSVLLNHASLRGTELNGACLDSAKLNGAYLWRAELDGADLSSAALNGVNLRLARLNGANLEFAELNGADLWSAYLRGANLRNAELNGADLGGVDLCGSDLESAKLNCADLRSSLLNGANLENAELNGAVLQGTHLNGASLFNTELHHAVFDVFEITGQGLRDGMLDGAYLEDARLRGALVERDILWTGIYFETGIDSHSSPDWSRIWAGSDKIPGGIGRSLFQNRLQLFVYWSAEDTVGAAANLFVSDSSGFLEARKAMVCRDTWVAEGMLSQGVSSSLWPEKGIGWSADILLEEMLANCRDSFEVVHSRLAVAARRWPGGLDSDLLVQIEDFLKQKASKDSTDSR
jgi:uncharacterized protein YjbI with pentapeptide repeats